MKYLLDTHILLWALGDSRLLSRKARNLIADEENICFFSPVSLTEIAIKHRKRPHEMPLSANAARAAFLAAGYVELPYTARHASVMDGLPPHHSDPFDRMLIAQTFSEGIKLISHDEEVAKYGDAIVQA